MKKSSDISTCHLANLVEASPNSVVEITFSGKVNYLNPTAKKLFPDLESKGWEHNYLNGIVLLIKKQKKNRKGQFVREVKVGKKWFHQSVFYDSFAKLIRTYGFDITDNKKTEEALRESQMMLNKTQEIAHLGTWARDILNKRIYWSNETYRIYGYQPGKIKPSSKAFDCLIHPDDAKAVANIYADTLRAEKDGYANTFRIAKRPKGKTRIIYEKCEHVRDKSGRIISSIGMVQDITERRLMENALLEAENYMESLFDYANALIVVWDPLLKITRFNHAFEKMTGYKAKDVIGKNLEILFPTEDKEKFLKKIKSISNEKYLKSIAIPIRQKNGDIRIALWNSANIYNKNGKTIISTIAQGQDITERQKAEEKLRNFSYAVEQSPASIIITDINGAIEYVNQGLVDTTGYSRKEITGNNPRMLKSGLTSHETYRDLWKTISSGREWKGELCNKKKNGELYWEQVSISPVKNAEGKIVNYLAVKNDITERRNLDQRKDEFITIAGHELGTPISAIRLMNQVLQEMLSDNPQALAYLKKIESQAIIQTDLINDLLDVSRIQAGKLRIKKTNVNLESLAKEAIESIPDMKNKNRIIVNSNIHQNISTDTERIRQVLVNFYSNAIKFSPEKEKILVKIKANKNEVIVSVEDRGIGIPKDQHNRIFKKFYRAYGTGNKTYPGLGMGLYISSQIMKLLNGKIWFKSTPGKGSIFYFSLPLKI